MTALEAVIEEFKSLPPAQQDEAVRFIHSLKAASHAHQPDVINETFGCLSPEEAADWEAAIEDCRRVDHENW